MGSQWRHRHRHPAATSVRSSRGGSEGGERLEWSRLAGSRCALNESCAGVGTATRLDGLRYPFPKKSATPQLLMDLIRERSDPAAAIDWREFEFKERRESMTELLKSWGTALARRIGL